MSFKTKYLKNAFFALVFSVSVFYCNFISSASIIDDFKATLGIKNEAVKGTESLDRSNELIDSELESRLTDDERKVVNQIESTITNIKKLDLNEIWKEFGDNLKGLNKNDTSEFFNEYPESLNSVKMIFSKSYLKIDDIRTENGRIYAKISINHPSIKEIVKIIMPEVIFNNASAFINDSITNENVNSILKSIKKALENNDISFEVLDLTIEFKEENGRWVIANEDKIAKEVESLLDFMS